MVRMRSLIEVVRNESPVPLTPRHVVRHGGLFQRSDAVAHMEAYGQLGTLWGIVETRATSLTKPEWTLYRNPGRRRDPARPTDDRTVVESHLAIDTWQQPTPFHDLTETLKMWSMYRDLVGESYLLPTTLTGSPGGPPVELWTVRPDQMHPVPSVTAFLAGWVHRSPDGHETPLEVSQVYQWKLPNPVDLYRGLGPVQALMVDIEAAKAGAAWNLNFFLNSAQPGGIIEANETMSDADFDRFMLRWNEQHQGVRNAHRVALVEGGVWKDRSFSMREMEFSKLRELSDTQLRQAFGMSKTMQGLSEDVNRATADTAQAVYGRLRDVPRLNELRRWLNKVYLPLFGVTTRDMEWDYDIDAVIPGDAEVANAERDSKVGAVVALIDAGADPATTLEVFGFPPIPFTAAPTPAAAIEAVYRTVGGELNGDREPVPALPSGQ